MKKSFALSAVLDVETKGYTRELDEDALAEAVSNALEQALEGFDGLVMDEIVDYENEKTEPEVSAEISDLEAVVTVGRRRSNPATVTDPDEIEAFEEGASEG